MDSEALRARRHKTFYLADGGVGTDDNNRDVPGRRVLPQARQDFVPPHIGQMKIEQNTSGKVLASEFQAQGPLHG